MEPQNELLILAGCFLLAWLIWRTKFTWILYPMSLIVLLLHELGHAIGALVTLGKVNNITVGAKKAVTNIEGGNLTVSVNSGHLGSLLLGFLIFAGAPTSLLLLAAAILVMTILWIRTLFGCASCIGISAVLIALFACLKGTILLVLIAKFLGVSCVLYSFLSLSGCRDDARLLAEKTHIPSGVWMCFWWLASAGTILLLWYTL